MKSLVIYSKKLRNLLLEEGYSEVKPPEPNIKFSNLLVFFFEDTESIRNFIKEYKEGKNV